MIRPNLILTAAVFPEPNHIDSIMQDWPRWLNEELIDYVEPMIYQKDTNYFINKQVNNFISRVINNDEEYLQNKVIVGIGTVVGGGDYLEYLDQIQFVLKMHHSYTIYSAALTLKYTKLRNTFINYNYKPISFTSSFEAKIGVLAKDIIRKIEEYYINISDEDFSGLIEALKNCRNEKTEENAMKVIDEIELIEDKQIMRDIYYNFIKFRSR